MSSTATEASAFVDAHRHDAMALGERLAGLTEEPDAFVEALSCDLSTLTDASHLESIGRACPETAARYAIRRPLRDTLLKPIRRALRETSSVSALRLARRLGETDHRDLRLYALPALERSLAEDPELSWQLMRQLGRAASDWIEVDALADVWARGVLAEPFRWSELEQLSYSQHTYERRLVAATLATLPHRVPSARRAELRPGHSERAIEMIRHLIGDNQVMVQKALAWAIREWSRVDAPRIETFLRDETAIAVEHRDGARAWVIRDALTGPPGSRAAELRPRLRGVRRDPEAASTSIAARQAAGFATVLAEANDAVAVQGDRYTRSRA